MKRLRNSGLRGRELVPVEQATQANQPKPHYHQPNMLQVRMVSFTGSTLVGQRIAQLTAASMKKVSLELGGKNAAVVFSDADMEAAVAGVAR